MTEANRRLLASLAHPDDESFGPGGTLAYYANQGCAVELICATNGDVGTVDPQLMRDFNEVAELRQAELDCAVQALGIDRVHLFGYRDSGMPGTADNQHKDALINAPNEELVGRITKIIRRFKPQVIITFDPIGGYHHPDHIRIHEATLQAFHAAPDPDQFPEAGEPFKPQKLYYHTFPRRWIKLLVRLMPIFGMDPSRWGRNNDIDLTAMTDEDIPIHAAIDIRSSLDAKELATACHASQVDDDGSPGFLLTWLRRLSLQREQFSRGYPPAEKGLKEHDLFAGVDFGESK
jgi:LmbE family N-acetylglucosaminyl deacetylase